MKNSAIYSLCFSTFILCGCNSNNNQINKPKGQPFNQRKLNKKHTEQDTLHNGKAKKNCGIYIIQMEG